MSLIRRLRPRRGERELLLYNSETRRAIDRIAMATHPVVRERVVFGRNAPRLSIRAAIALSSSFSPCSPSGIPVTGPATMSAGDFTRREAAVVARVRTPRQAQAFVDSVAYNTESDGPSARTFRGVMHTGRAHCLEAALCVATILEPHGFPPTLLDLRSKDRLDHVLFLFEHRGHFGTVARSRDPGLHGRLPVFRTIESLVRSYMAPFIDRTGRVIGYATYDLRNLRGCNWRLSERNVWTVQRALISNRGRRLGMSNDQYRRWHRRFLRFCDDHPGEKPLYYSGRERWMSTGPRKAA